MHGCMVHTKQWSPREKFSTWKRRSLDTFQKVVRVTTTGILVSKVSRVDVANKIAVPKSRNEIFLGGLFSGLAHGLISFNNIGSCLWISVYCGGLRQHTVIMWQDIHLAGGRHCQSGGLHLCDVEWKMRSDR